MSSFGKDKYITAEDQRHEDEVIEEIDRIHEQDDFNSLCVELHEYVTGYNEFISQDERRRQTTQNVGHTKHENSDDPMSIYNENDNQEWNYMSDSSEMSEFSEDEYTCEDCRRPRQSCMCDELNESAGFTLDHDNTIYRGRYVCKDCSEISTKCLC